MERLLKKSSNGRGLEDRRASKRFLLYTRGFEHIKGIDRINSSHAQTRAGRKTTVARHEARLTIVSEGGQRTRQAGSLT